MDCHRVSATSSDDVGPQEGQTHQDCAALLVEVQRYWRTGLADIEEGRQPITGEQSTFLLQHLFENRQHFQRMLQSRQPWEFIQKVLCVHKNAHHSVEMLEVRRSKHSHELAACWVFLGSCHSVVFVVLQLDPGAGRPWRFGNIIIKNLIFKLKRHMRQQTYI